jgi:uncharacterized Tic20 family protein
MTIETTTQNLEQKDDKDKSNFLQKTINYKIKIAIIIIVLILIDVCVGYMSVWVGVINVIMGMLAIIIISAIDGVYKYKER